MWRTINWCFPAALLHILLRGGGCARYMGMYVVWAKGVCTCECMCVVPNNAVEQGRLVLQTQWVLSWRQLGPPEGAHTPLALERIMYVGGGLGERMCGRWGGVGRVSA